MHQTHFNWIDIKKDEHGSISVNSLIMALFQLQWLYILELEMA